MARSFPQSVIDAVNANGSYAVQFVKIDVDNNPNNSLYLNTSYRSLTNPIDSRSYLPASNVLSISPVEETQDIKANALNITLSGVNGAEIIAALETVKTIGGTVTVFEGFLSSENILISGTVFQKWEGIIFSNSTNVENTERSGDINITIECKSKIGTLFSTKGGRHTSLSSFQNVDTTDKSMEFVASMVDFNPNFGARE